MRRLLTLLVTLLLVFTLPVSSQAASNHENPPVVHAVLFWTRGCPYCEQTLTRVLPDLQDKYQGQLSILLIELAGSKDVDNLYAFGISMGLSKEQIVVPFLLVGSQVLIGVDEIQNKLSGMVDRYLVAGGVEYPDLPQLTQLLPKGVNYATSEQYLLQAPVSATSTNSTGMTLAWVIMVLMWLALIFAAVMIVRAFQGTPIGEYKGWLSYAIPILCAIGLGVSIYLSIVEVTHTRAICGPVGDCNAVQSSPYAKLFGFLPIALLGALGYVAILVAWLWRRVRQDGLSKIAGPVMYGMALFGTLFTIYLTYLELFVIHAVCLWCLSSAVIITVLMLICLPPITQWLAISDEEE